MEVETIVTQVCQAAEDYALGVVADVMGLLIFAAIFVGVIVWLYANARKNKAHDDAVFAATLAKAIVDCKSAEK